jgi:hypothetical protein
MGDFLIRNNIFYGYIGTQNIVEIPEGVIEIEVYNYYPSWVNIISIRFPSTIEIILKDNRFYDYLHLTTVFVSTNTVIEDGAFKAGVDIIYY